MFTKEDFKDSDNIEKLRLIITEQLGLPLMTNFHSLDTYMKAKFNKSLNLYIKGLPDNWRDTVDNDFAVICKTKLFNETFRAEDHVPQMTLNSMETAEVLPPVTTTTES